MNANEQRLARFNELVFPAGAKAKATTLTSAGAVFLFETQTQATKAAIACHGGKVERSFTGRFVLVLSPSDVDRAISRLRRTVQS